MNWKIHTDNDLLYYANKSLHERFPKTYLNNNFCIGKTIIRGNIRKIRIRSTHRLDKKIQRCNGFGKQLKLLSIFVKYQIIHFII